MADGLHGWWVGVRGFAVWDGSGELEDWVWARRCEWSALVFSDCKVSCDSRGPKSKGRKDIEGSASHVSREA